MPELPEVETIKNDLSKKIINKQVKSVQVNLKKTVKSDYNIFISTLKNSKIIDIGRRGKLLIFKLNKADKYLLIHLKMTGQLIYVEDNKIIAGGHSNEKIEFNLPNKYSHLIINFSHGAKLFFNDLRRFGYARLVGKRELNEILNKFGPEPLSSGLNEKSLTEILKNRKISVKAVLLDQAKIAGLGNIYADEILFAAGVRPDRQANRIKKKEVNAILQAIKKIIPQAIKKRGTTFNNYVDSDGKSGNFLNYLKVYRRTGKKCGRCGQGVIKKTRVAGRGTHYCPNCQK